MTAINPITTRVAAAEEKLNLHIVTSEKCFAGITNKETFELTVKMINKDVRSIKKIQEKNSDKLDTLYELLLNLQSKEGM